MASRKFTCTGFSSKFWNIELQGKSFVVQFGRIGTTGQMQKKSFASEDAAQKEHDKLIKQKLGKGYREISAKQAAQSTAKGAAVKAPVQILPAKASQKTAQLAQALAASKSSKAAAAPPVKKAATNSTE